MGVTVAIAQAALRTSTGTQNITTPDLGGLTPKGVLFYLSRATANDTTTNTATISYGAATGTANEWVIAANSENNVSTTDAVHHARNDACMLVSNPGSGTIVMQAEFSAFISDGVTINVVTSDGVAYLINAVFFAGTDVTAHADDVQIVNTVDTATVITSPSFNPDFLFVGDTSQTMSTTSGDAEPVFGFVHNGDTITQHSYLFMDVNGQAATDVKCYLSGDRGAGILLPSGSRDWVGDFGGFGASGFSITPRLNGGNNDSVGFLALNFGGAASVNLSAQLSPTAIGNQSITTPGWKPQAVVGFQSYVTASDILIDNTGDAGAWGLVSFTTSGSQLSTGYATEEAAGVTDTQSFTDARAINVPNHDGTVALSASFTEFTSTGWNLGWSDVEAAGRYGIFVAFQEFSAVTTASEIFVLDAVLLKTGTKTHVLDTTLLKTNSPSHQLDTVLKSEANARTHVLDAVLLDTGTRTHVLDTVLSQVATKTHVLDSVLLKTQTKTFVLDAVLLGTETKTFLLDTVLQKTSTKTFVLDTVLSQTATRTHVLDSVLLKTQTETHVLDTVLTKTNAKTFVLDTVLSKTGTKAFLLDTVLSKTQTQTFVLDAVLSKVATQTHVLDSVLLKTQTKSHVLDTVLKSQATTKTFTLDAVLSQAATRTHVLDTVLLKTDTKTHKLDTTLQKTQTKTFVLDAFLSGAGTVSHTLDTVLKSQGNARTHVLDAILQVTGIKAHTLDATLLQTQTETHVLDSVLKSEGVTKTFVLSTFLSASNIKTFSLDTVLKSQGNQRTFILETVLTGGTQTKTFVLSAFLVAPFDNDIQLLGEWEQDVDLLGVFDPNCALLGEWEQDVNLLGVFIPDEGYIGEFEPDAQLLGDTG